MLERVAQAMGMSDAVWRRHANPLSVWSRFTCLPLIVLAIWSWGWIGVWALIPIAGALLWTFANPRVFPEPSDTDSWASLGVMEERIHIYRPHEVNAHHKAPLLWLTWAPLVGIVVLVFGLIVRDAALTTLGTLVTIGLKMWFVDRMVWIAREWHASGHEWSDLDQL